jgi:hypothetical protein
MTRPGLDGLEYLLKMKSVHLKIAQILQPVISDSYYIRATATVSVLSPGNFRLYIISFYKSKLHLCKGVSADQRVINSQKIYSLEWFQAFDQSVICLVNVSSCIHPASNREFV